MRKYGVPTIAVGALPTKENMMTWTKPSFTKLELACEVTLYRHAR